MSVSVFSQTDKSENEKITLKNGTVYIGKITLKTESVVMLQTENGTRYQFPASDVEKIEPTEMLEKNAKNPYSPDENNTDFAIMLDVSSNVFLKNAAFANTAAMQADIVLGAKNVAGKNLFLGLGAGYENIFAKPANVHLLQIFGRIHKVFGNQRFSPFSAVDLGYAFVSDEGWKGGIFASASGGISVRISAENSLFLGLNLGIQGCHTMLTEVRNGIPYQYRGNAFLPKIGLKFGVMF